MQRINILEAEHDFQHLIQQAAGGDEIIITDRLDHPVAKLTSFHPQGWKRKAGNAKGKIWMADDFDAPLEDFKEYMP